MSESKIVLRIEVDAVSAPSECCVLISTVPAIRGPTEWTEDTRHTADAMARALLAAGPHYVEFKEEGVYRHYRVPTRVQNGWSKVDP